MQLGKALQQARNLVLLTPRPHLSQSLYLKALQLCIDGNAERPAHAIHSHMITNGFESNLHLGNKLLIFYSKVGDLATARRVFDRMPEQNVLSWTAMISGYSNQGYYENAMLVFVEMHRAGPRPNQFTFGSALKACAGLGWLRAGLQIQGCAQKGRFARNEFVQCSLLTLHARCGEMEGARVLFDLMEERDLVSWNAIIGGYAVRGFDDEAFRIFRSMIKEGVAPDAFTFLSILKTSTGGSDSSEIAQLQGVVTRLGFESCNAVAGALIGAYANCGSIPHAYRLYKDRTQKDVISCTGLIAGLAHHSNEIREAFDLFKEVVMMQLGVDDVMLCLMLNVCANTASLSMGKQIHAFALKCQPVFDAPMSNALIDMYVKSGEVADARRTFEEMEDENVISWTSLIMGYGMHGYGDEAITLYTTMESQGLKPNEVTLLSLLFACSHAGLTDEGRDFFDAMVGRYQIVPREEHFACVIDLFARRGKLREAYDLIREVGVMSSSSVWAALLSACRTYRDVTLGEVVAKHLLDTEPGKSVHYVVLAAIYAEAGIWDKAWRTRKLMEEKGSPKTPGCSLLPCTENRTLVLRPC